MYFNNMKMYLITIPLVFILTNIIVEFATVVFLGNNNKNDNEVLVNTKYGKIKGSKRYTMYKRLPYYSFKGIPYAQAPILDLRFKPPLQAIPWNDTLRAYRFRKKCITYIGNGSEDCLFMNIYTTDISQPTKNLPVLITIHGGAFKRGSGSFIGPDFLMNEDPNLVVVSFNYRLGPLGFVSFGTPEYPGNLGLKDQLMALKWVNENIHLFGGDKNKVTLYGTSAGSVAAHLHVLSPESSGLFQRAILAGATALNPWGFRTHNHLPELFKLAEINGVKTSNFTELIEYLKSVDYKVLFAPNSTLREERFNIKHMERLFAPILEPPGSNLPFLSKTPKDLLSEHYKSDMDIMFGVNSDEANVILKHELQNPKTIENLNEHFEVALPLHSSNVNLNFKSKKYKKMSQRVRKFYFNSSGGNITDDTLSEYSKMISDIRFNYAINLSVQLHANYTSGRIYYYKFSGDTYLNYQKIKLGGQASDFSGATHGDDSFYAFNRFNNRGYYSNVKNGTVEHSLISDVCKIYMNFIKYGNPTPSNEPIYFEPVRRNTVNYLHLTNKGMVAGRVDPFGESMRFWDRLLKKYKLFY